MKMNTVVNDSQPLDICEGCPYHFLVPIRKSVKGFEDYTFKDYSLVCKHAEMCKRAYRKGLVDGCPD